MQQTATSTASTATAVTTKITGSSVNIGGGGGSSGSVVVGKDSAGITGSSGNGNGAGDGAGAANEVDISQVTAAAALVTTAASTSVVTPTVKLEQLTANAATTTTAAQVITVVAPSHTTQAHGQPVVVQVSSGGQFIAVAVSPDKTTQNAGSQHGDTVTSVGTPATNVSTEDEDQSAANFDDFAGDTSYTNGNSNSGAMTYYTTDSYTTATAYYNSSVTYSQGVNQILADGAYLVMEHTDPNVLTTSNTQRTPPQTVQWLIENYETAEGVSLPRSTLYSHYQQHCQQQGIEPVNAASFGKLIRSVFIGLRTRRLGTRGNSKYHYYGIRVKPNSPLQRAMDQTTVTGNSNSGNTSGSESSSVSQQPPVKRAKTSSISSVTPTKTAPISSTVTENSHQATLSATSPEILQSYLGDPKSILSSVWPEEPTVSCNDTDSPSALATRFAACYRKHYEQVINAIGLLQFNLVEDLWRQFWQPSDQNTPVTINENNNSLKEDKHGHLTLTLDQLHQLTTTTPSPSSTSNEDEAALTSLADWIIQTDYTLYNSLITSLLLPNLLKPIPQQLTQQIRNFAKNIGPWMTNSLAGYDETFITLKVSAVSAFSHTLRRYTSLNHLSSAARAVLQNQQQIQQMINDLNRVDFKNVQEQASWVCQCDDHIVEQIEHSFKMLLQETNPFDKWGLWCEQVLDMCLQDNEVRSSTQFFFKWGFYSSLVMRDLTLRSASSFGSFHLIRLLFDEYIFYLIEHRVAKATGKTPLQVLGEARSVRNQNMGPN